MGIQDAKINLVDGMIKKKYLIVLLFVISISVVLVQAYTNPSSVSGPFSKCFSNSDCEWKITNCCSENAGANWGCVNTRTYVPKIDCSKVNVLCPQVISPKPTSDCICNQGECVVK